MSSRAAGGFVCGVVFAVVAQASGEGSGTLEEAVEASHAELAIPVNELSSVKTELKGLGREFWADAALVRPIGSPEEALQWRLAADDKSASASSFQGAKLQMRLSNTQSNALSGTLATYVRSDTDVTCAGALATCLEACPSPPSK